MIEHGFYHPARGYWQTVSDPDADTLAGYPEGTISIPLKPGADYEWDGGAWVHMPPDPAEALAAERAGMIVSRFQAKAAMQMAGILTQVEAAVAAADGLTQLAWSDAIEYRRDSRAINTIASAIGMTGEQVDDMFRAAMQIEA